MPHERKWPVPPAETRPSVSSPNEENPWKNSAQPFISSFDRTSQCMDIGVGLTTWRDLFEPWQIDCQLFPLFLVTPGGNICRPRPTVEMVQQFVEPVFIWFSKTGLCLFGSTLWLAIFQRVQVCGFGDFLVAHSSSPVAVLKSDVIQNGHFFFIYSWSTWTGLGRRMMLVWRWSKNGTTAERLLSRMYFVSNHVAVNCLPCYPTSNAFINTNVGGVNTILFWKSEQCLDLLMLKTTTIVPGFVEDFS